MARPKLGELLIKTGYLRPEQLAEALEEQKKWGGRLGRLLAEMRMVNEDIVLKATCLATTFHLLKSKPVGAAPGTPGAPPGGQ